MPETEQTTYSIAQLNGYATDGIPWAVNPEELVTINGTQVVMASGSRLHEMYIRFYLPDENQTPTMKSTDTFEISLNVSAVTQRFRLYFRQVPWNGGVEASGDITLDEISGNGWHQVSGRANIYTSVYDVTRSTLVIKGHPDDDCFGIVLHMGPVGFDGATSSNASAVMTFNYMIINPEGTRPDPYANAGTSGAAGGDGTFDFSSTDIPIPGLPQIGAMSTGFLNLYNPSAAQLRSLAAYMWSGAFDLDNFRKIVADPMDAILGLHIIPTVTGHPASTPATLSVGNISTGLSMPQLTEQYYEVDCQTVQIPAKWGAYLDYAPYTTLSLYLPYIGIVPISADDCMRGSITVKYHIDALSGTCTAFVYCYSNRGADGHTLYTFTGSCACECPVTEGQYANAVIAGFKAVGGIIGAAAGAAAGSAGMVMGGIGDAANAALSAIKPEIGRSGNMGGSAGLMGIQYPYLILTVPRMCTPGEQNVMRGYPSYITRTLSQLSGFNAIDVTHMEGMTCTDDEIAEIVQQLSEGVIF